jgi:hypothetical protein
LKTNINLFKKSKNQNNHKNDIDEFLDDFEPNDSDEVVQKKENIQEQDEKLNQKSEEVVILKQEKDAHKCIYITPKLETQITEKTDIILAPQFYWVREQEFENSDFKLLKKIASSVFEGQFEDIENYDFLVTPSEKDNHYIFIAYNMKEIFSKLKEKYGAKENLIKKVYTAQTEFLNIHKPLTVNRNFVVLKEAGIISEIPHNQTNDSYEYVSTYIRKTPRTTFKLKLNAIYSNSVSKLQLAMLSLIFFVIFISFGLQILNLTAQSEKISKDVEYFTNKYNLPQTSFELDSIKSRLFAIQREQFKIRRAFKWFDNLNTEKYGKVTFLSVEKNELLFKMNLKSSKLNINYLIKLIQKTDKNADINRNKSLLSVKIKLK